MREPRTTTHIIDTHHHVGELSLGIGDDGTGTNGTAIRIVFTTPKCVDLIPANPTKLG